MPGALLFFFFFSRLSLPLSLYKDICMYVGFCLCAATACDSGSAQCCSRNNWEKKMKKGSQLRRPFMWKFWNVDTFLTRSVSTVLWEVSHEKKKGERKGEKKQAKEIRINLRTSSTHREKVWLRVASEQTRDESYNSTRATTLFPCPTLLLLLGSAWWDFLHLTGAEILGLRTSVAWRDNEHLVVSFISTLHSERKPLFSFSSSFWAGCLTSWQKKKSKSCIQ